MSFSLSNSVYLEYSLFHNPNQPFPGRCQVRRGPAGQLLTAALDQCAGLIFIGQIPADIADLVFVQKLDPFISFRFTDRS